MQLKPSKTRLAHTLDPGLSEDGMAGFDFLGHHLQQFPRGKYRSNEDNHGRKLGFQTLITPSRKARRRHQQAIAEIIRRHKTSPQEALIKALNPIIRGWSSYYRASDIGTSGISAQQDYLTYLKLRRWAKRRTANVRKSLYRYWQPLGGRRWTFATAEDNPLRLIYHTEFASSSNNHVLVKGDRSPYDGDWVYWSVRLGRHPELPKRQAILLKQQKGTCAWCGLYFRQGDVMEVDHRVPLTLGGKDEWVNLQLLHRHCHHEKTARDGSQKSALDK